MKPGLQLVPESFLPSQVEDASGGRSLTFTTMLKGLCHLEHLVLTHNGMFGDVAMELAKAGARRLWERCELLVAFIGSRGSGRTV